MNNELQAQPQKKVADNNAGKESANDTLQGRVVALPADWPSSLTETPVHWVKSNFYRTINVDGVFGGPSPAPGKIIVGIYSQHFPYPEVSMNDQRGNEVLEKRVSKFGLEHELEASLVLDINAAKNMVTWLQKAIANTEAFMAAVQQQASKNNL